MLRKKPAGMWIQRSRSLPPASSSRTVVLPSAVRRLASTQPAEPAPTTIKSNSSVAIIPLPRTCCTAVMAPPASSLSWREAERRGDLGHGMGPWLEQPLRRNARPFAECRQLRPHHILCDATLTRGGIEPAIRPRQHPLRITHHLGHALDAFCDSLGMLDKIRDAVDHPGNDDLIGIERKIAQHRILVSMTRIGERQHEASNVELAQDGHDLMQLHVAIVRPFVIAPAGMQPHAVARYVDQRGIDGGNDAIDKAEKITKNL